MNCVQDQNNTMSYLMCLKSYYYVPHTVLSVIVKNKNIHGLWCTLLEMAQLMVRSTFCISIADHGCKFSLR